MTQNIQRNLPIPRSRQNKGTTLIELIVVMGIFVVMAGILSGIISSVLRGNNKSRTSNIISQSGTYAINYLTDTIQQSRQITQINGASVINCVPSVPSITSMVLEYPELLNPVENLDHHGRRVTYNGTNNIRIEFGRVNSLGVFTAGALNGSGVFVADAQNFIDLVDNTQVVINTASFTCTQESVIYPPRITINLDIRQGGTSTLQEFTSDSSFNTSVVLRNYDYAR